MFSAKGLSARCLNWTLIGRLVGLKFVRDACSSYLKCDTCLKLAILALASHKANDFDVWVETFPYARNQARVASESGTTLCCRIRRVYAYTANSSLRNVPLNVLRVSAQPNRQ